MLDCTYMSKPTDLYATKSELNSYAIFKKKKSTDVRGSWDGMQQTRRKNTYITNG